MASLTTNTAHGGDGLPLLDFGNKATRTTGSVSGHQNRPATFLRNVGLKGPLFARRAFTKDHKEYRKVILSSDKWTAVLRCSVHVVPICGTVVLAYLNLAGFYIGYDLEGWHGGNADSFKRLLLQGTAKLFELLVVASLTTIILDILRQELIGKDGVPLGLILSHVEFVSVGWFFKPEFLSGGLGFKNRKKGFLLMAGLIICGIVAVLVGPTAALLLVPAYRQSWAAGGTDFWIAGNSTSIWPEIMDSDSVSAKCNLPANHTILSQNFDFSACAWAGYQALLADYRSAHQIHLANLTMTDGIVTRHLQRIATAAESYSIAPCVACASFSTDIALEWVHATGSVSGVSSYAHYKRTGRERPTIRITGYAPIVRASCEMSRPRDLIMSRPHDLTNATWKYPYLPNRGSIGGLSYELPSRAFLNTTSIAMRWREIPDGSTFLTNGSATDYYPSAFLDLEVPWGGYLNGSFSYLYTCSIDARWIKTDTIGSEYDDSALGKYYTYAQPQGSEWPFAEETIPESGSIRMDSTWLDNLMPPYIDVQRPGWTTLTSILHTEYLDDAHTDQVPLLPNTQSIVATYFADGLSRNGYEQNGGLYGIAAYHSKSWDVYNVSRYLDFHNTLIRSTAVLPRPDTWLDRNSTMLRWSITIAGYAYKADDVSYQISLALLFLYVILALAHTIWVLYRGTSSEAWDSPVELLALAQNSPPDPVGLGNTSSGISHGRTLRRSARVRVVDSLVSVSEQVQLLLGPDAQSSAANVQAGVAYGQLLLHARTL